MTAALMLGTLGVVVAAAVVAVRVHDRTEAVRDEWDEAARARLTALFNDTNPKGK